MCCADGACVPYFQPLKKPCNVTGDIGIPSPSPFPAVKVDDAEHKFSPLAAALYDKNKMENMV